MAESLSCDAVVDAGLVERYLTGRLSETEVEAFESHYLTCARCQSELRLAAAIQDVLPEVRNVSRAGAVADLTANRWFGRRQRVGAIAAAIAAVLAGVLLVQPWGSESLRHGEPAVETASVPAAAAPVGDVATVKNFRWTPVASSDLYRVTLYDATGSAIWQTETREAQTALPESVQLQPGVLYLWQVDARVGWDRWVSSDLVRFTIREP